MTIQYLKGIKVGGFIADRVIDLACQIQQVAAPTCNEAERAALVLAKFQELSMADIWVDSIGNVFAHLPGSGNARPVVVSAHLDTVFPANVDLKLIHRPNQIVGPGIGDNALGVAALFGIVWTMRQHEIQLPGDVWLVANTCEEGLGNLNGMRWVVQRFGGAPAAYIIIEGMAYGHIYHRALGVNRYRITVRTPGGHSWVDNETPSAIHVLADLVTRLVEIPRPVIPRTTLNVGVIEGGISVNTVAADAHAEVDIRSEDEAVLRSLSKQVESLVEKVEQANVKVVVELIGRRPGGEIPANHPLVQTALRCLETQRKKPLLCIGSTDANLPLSFGFPAVCIGVTTGGGAHTLNEYIHTRPVNNGLAQIVEMVKAIFLLDL